MWLCLSSRQAKKAHRSDAKSRGVINQASFVLAKGAVILNTKNEYHKTRQVLLPEIIYHQPTEFVIYRQENRFVVTEVKAMLHTATLTILHNNFYIYNGIYAVK